MIKTYKKTTVTEEPLLVISYDSNSESPREESNLGYFITVDRDYKSPDRHERLENIVKNTGEIANSREHHERLIRTNYRNVDDRVIAIYPIVKNEHSGVSYSLGSKTGFDYSNNGFYIVTEKTQKEMGTPKKRFEAVIKDEIETYNKWINGEVYGYTLYDKNGELVDSVWGFYDLEAIRENLPKEYKNEDLSAYIK